MAHDIEGLWKYTQKDQTFQYTVDKKGDKLRFRQELSEFGIIDEPLTLYGEYYECSAPHGKLRLKRLNDRMITQFQRQDSAHWSSALLAKRMHIDVTGLFYQGGEPEGVSKRVCTINKRKIRWFSGVTCTYNYIGRSKIQIRLDGHRYIATIKDDGSLLEWSDGDVWIRKKKIVVENQKANVRKGRKSLRDLNPRELRRRKYSEPNLDAHEDKHLETKPRSFSEADISNAMHDLTRSDVNDRLAAAFNNKQRNKELQEGDFSEELGTSKKRKRRARWDDENLAKNESEKVPRMKIDEPPTPFEDIDEEEILAMNDNNLANLPTNGDINLRNGANQVLLSNPDFVEQMMMKVQEGRKEMDDPDSEEDSEEERQKHFKTRRAAHYNEGFIWKAMKANPDLITGEQEIHE